MVVGIDLGGTIIKGILTDKKGATLSFKEVDTPQSAREIEKSILKLVETLATSASVSKIDIQAVGIGSAGSIDKKRGMIIQSPNIPGLNKHPLAKNIERKTGYTVLLENDATSALIGTWWKGDGSKYRNWIMITLGTGIGGGVILDNKIYTGQSGNAMEVGHMTIDYQGRDCPCGNKGCLEQYCSATALVKYTKSLLNEFPSSSLHQRMEEGKLTAKIIYEEAVRKDEAALMAFEETATYLGYGMVNLINLFNPEAIILGGGMSDAHKLLLPVVKRIVQKRALPGLKEKVQFIVLKNQSIIPAMGSARIALDAVNENRK